MRHECEPAKSAPAWTGRFIVRLAPPVEDALVKLHESRTDVQINTVADVVSALVPADQLPPGISPLPRPSVRKTSGNGNEKRRPRADAELLITVEPAIARSLLDLHSFLHRNPALAPFTAAAVSPSFAHLVVALEWTARQSLLPPRASLLAFFYVDARRLGLSADSAEAYVAELQALTAVDSVVPEPILENAAAWKVTMDDLEQGYLRGGKAGPNRFRGINAAVPSVWGQVDGAPIGFVDFEFGWDLQHSEFPQSAVPQPLHNVASTDERAREHGTSTLSVVLAKDNADLAVGIAPGATFIGVVSPIQVPGTVDNAEKSDVVGALLAARKHMQPGDVLLIEQQLSITNAVNFPMEAVRPYLDAMRLLAASGIVLIEPGGNLHHDLDQPLPTLFGQAPTHSLNRNAPDFIDSGAILVGACRDFVLAAGKATPSHIPVAATPRGSRIDCYAWGEQVEVVRTPTAKNPSTIDPDFNGTSAASAIVAGAALLVQSLSWKKHNVRLTPLQVRYLLANRALGTPIVDGNAVIGSMPDLSKIAAHLKDLPDVFVGDAPDDDGSRSTPLRFDSPDIVVRSQPIAAPGADLGANGDFAETAPPSDPLNSTANNFIYLRVRNDGRSLAENTKLHLLWAEAGVMIPPNRWNFVAVSDATDVPKRNAARRAASLAVAPRITWDPSLTNPPLPIAPACVALISVATHEADPAPLLSLPVGAAAVPPTLTPAERALIFDSHLQLLHSNNVGVLNRHSFANLVTGAGGVRTGDLAFRVFGASGVDEPFDFELTTETASVGDDVVLVLAAPLLALVAAQLAVYGMSAALDAQGLHFPANGSLRIPGVTLVADADFGCTAHAKAAGSAGGVWSIAQIARGAVVGRLTISLDPVSLV